MKIEDIAEIVFEQQRLLMLCITEDDKVCKVCPG